MTGPHRQMLDSHHQTRNGTLKVMEMQMRMKVAREMDRIPTALLVADAIW